MTELEEIKLLRKFKKMMSEQENIDIEVALSKL